MIEKLKTVNKKYSILYGKKRDEKEDINKKQIQIEKIKNIFKDNDTNEKNNDENEKLNEKIYKVNFNSNNIESFNNFSLIKNSIGSEKLETIFQNLKEKKPSNKKNNKLNVYKESNKSLRNNINNTEKKENIVENNNDKDNDNINNKIKNESNNNKKLNEDLFNVTQEQMKIFDNGVDKLYNDHKKNMKMKIFQINHPYLHNIKLINNKVESTMSSMTKEERLLPLLQKQKTILKKIQEDNKSRSNSSLSKINNDLKEYSISNIDNKSDRLFSKKNFNKKNNLEMLPHNIQRTLDNNYNILDNLTASDNFKNNSSEKINLKPQRKISYKPYTLQQYKNKYENNNNLRIILGGLGPNLGSEDWNKKHKILERKQKYSDYIKNDSEFNIFNKKLLKIRKSEDSKTVASKKDSEFSSYDSNSGIRNKILKTENYIINNNKIKLPLINQKFKSNHIVQLKRKNNFQNDTYNINQDHDIEGGEKDLKQLIKQYEEYNEKFKL